MELACPSCATHFSVPDNAIGPKGRKLKCSSCGHTWRQMPPDSPVAAPAVAVAPAVAAAPAAAEVVRSGKDVVSDVLPPAGPVPLEMEPGQTLPDTPRAAMPASAPALARGEDRPARAGDDDLLSGLGDDPFEGLGGAADDDPLAGLTLSDGSAEDAFEDFGNAGGGTGSDNDLGDLDDLLSGDPEPIPAMFSRGGDDDEEDSGTRRRKGGVGTMLLMVVLVMSALGGGAWLFRDRLVQAVPALEGVFALAGIDAAPLGHGLIFRDVTSDLIDANGAQMLVVRGLIANETDRERTVPFLRLGLYDRTGAMLEGIVAEPPQVLMAPGETVGFRIQADNPSAATHRFTVDWVPAPAPR